MSMDDDRFITSTRCENGAEVTSWYDKTSGLIFTTSAPLPPAPSLAEMAAVLGLSDDDLDNLVTASEYLAAMHHSGAPMPPDGD
jgi:hypothetical protein